jgi:CheY-like chemotaxis protein
MPIPARESLSFGEVAGGARKPEGTMASHDRKDATAGAWSSPAAKTSGTRLRRPLVLVVDDHTDTRDGFAEYLRMGGFRIMTAENGVIAIKVAREAAPDAIVLDYAMPLMDGAHAAIFLKRDPSTRHIPIVMVTAFRDRIEGQRVCDAYFEKPCDPQDVTNALWSLLGTNGAESSGDAL